MRATVVKQGLIWTLAILCVGCHAKRVAPPVPAATLADYVADSIALESVVQTSGDHLTPNVPTELLITIRYKLSTRDLALLVLEMEQFSDKESCINSDGLEGGANRRETVATEAAHITAGTRTIQMRMVWPGGKNEEGVAKSGTVSFRASLRSEDPKYTFLTYRFGTQYCMRF